jgi:hypothetical protein
MGVRVECLLKTKLQRLECSGGEACCVYEMPDTRHYSEIEAHKQRTLAHDQRKHGHQSHWKKEEHKAKEYNPDNHD